MSITKKAMVLNLQVGIWQGDRLDKEASRKVTEDANADGDAARVNKHLVPKEALKPVVTAANAARSHFYAKTLPWKDNGDRLLTRAMYMGYIEEHERLVGVFEDVVEEFLTTSYPAAREQAEFRMGDLFKAEDYPPVESLRRRFYINLDIDAVTEAGDFRVEMDKAQLDSVKSAMETALQERIGRAMRDVWERLADTLGHFANKIGSEEIFRDATVRNLKEIVDLLPGLNVLDDPDLEAIRKEIDAKLTGYDPKDLRKDVAVRTAAAKEADEIMDRMRGFMRGIGACE
jgi:hypothetical protein